MRKPNLFIVGAPKCATTTLHEYLARHPECYMSRIKEPAYFSRSHVREDIRLSVPYFHSETEYLKLFSDATMKHKVVGESSTCYMRAESDLRELHAFSGDPKIIALVRDPVQLVSSYFHYMRHQGWEPLASLQEAWEIQDERCGGRVEAPSANRPDSLAYRNVALLGHQAERLYRMFGRDNVLILISDDLRRNPVATGREVQRFLELTYDADIVVPLRNTARGARFRSLDGLVKRHPKSVITAKNRMKRMFGVKSFGIRRLIDRLNSIPLQHSVDSRLRDEMRDFFRSDVALLGRLLNRDLFALWGWEGNKDVGRTDSGSDLAPGG